METKTKDIIGQHSHYDDMVIAMLPLLVCATVIYSVRVLLICAVAMLTARTVDAAVSTVRKQDIDIQDKSSIVAALTFVLMMPVSVPLYIVIVTVALAVFIGKHIFGGKEVYPFNLTALAMCLAIVNWPQETLVAVKPFTQVNFWTGASRSTASGAAVIKSGGLPYISTFDLLLGNSRGAIGSSFILVILSVAAFLIYTDRITWHAPVSFLATCAVIALLFPRIYGLSPLYSLKYEMLNSALVFYAVFLLNEPATTPAKPVAKLAFGVLCGVLTMLFRYYGYYDVGGCFAILLVNATDDFWDRAFEEGGLFTKGGFSAFFASLKNRARTTAGKASGRQVQRKRKPAQRPAQGNVAAVRKEPKAKRQRNTAKQALDMISEAEDSIDLVDFSTRTIDVREILKAMRESEE